MSASRDLSPTTSGVVLGLEISFRVERHNHCDDVLTAIGAYARVEPDGRLFVFSGTRFGLGLYPADDWKSVSRFTSQASGEGE